MGFKLYHFVNPLTANGQLFWQLTGYLWSEITSLSPKWAAQCGDWLKIFVLQNLIG